MDSHCYHNQLQQHNGVNPVTLCPCGFMNNIFSGTKYRVSPEGVSLMYETNNLASHLERIYLNLFSSFTAFRNLQGCTEHPVHILLH